MKQRRQAEELATKVANFDPSVDQNGVEWKCKSCKVEEQTYRQHVPLKL